MSIGEHQGDAERDDDLGVVALRLGRHHARTGDLRDQKAVQQPADREHDRPREHGADDRAGIGAEERQHAEAGDQIVGGVHAQHHEIAVREVHDPHDAKDDAQPDAHQPIGAADQQAGGKRLQRVDQHPFEVHEIAQRLFRPAPRESCTTRATLLS
jgi:hypothetical protein